MYDWSSNKLDRNMYCTISVGGSCIVPNRSCLIEVLPITKHNNSGLKTLIPSQVKRNDNNWLGYSGNDI